MTETIKPTFEKISSPDGKLHLEVCPELGGSITGFFTETSAGRINFLRAYDRALPADPLNFSSFPMTPFASRLGYGKLSFQGEVLEVGPPFADEEHPNHGNGWHLPWHIKEKSENRIVLSLDAQKTDESPYAYYAEQEFSLDNDGLHVTLSITNKSGRTLPYGTGMHLYFDRTDTTVLQSNVNGVWMSENMMPTELIELPEKWAFDKGVTLDPAILGPAENGADGSAFIDHAFSEWDGNAKVTWPEQGASLTVKADELFKNYIIYVPGNNETFFCAEPVTNTTDGFNLKDKGVEGTGTIELEDQEKLTGQLKLIPKLG